MHWRDEKAVAGPRLFLRLLLLAFSRREQNIIKDQAVTRGVGVKIKVCWLATPSGRTLRIMAAVIGPMPSPQLSIYVPHVAGPSVFAHDQNSGLNGGRIESRGLPHEFLDDKFVILREQRGNDVPLCRKIEDRKIVVSLVKKNWGGRY